MNPGANTLEGGNIYFAYTRASMARMYARPTWLNFVWYGAIVPHAALDRAFEVVRFIYQSNFNPN